MEPIFRQEFTLSDIHLDCFGRIKPSTFLYFAQEAAGQHCQLLALDWDTLAGKNLFWAVTRHRVQISRLPTRGETITVETWPMPTTKVAFPRSVIGYDSLGREIFRSISLWVLMDTESRAMVLPGKSGILVDGTLRGTELTVPHSILPSVKHNRQERTGHMNNTRYMDWVDDLLPSAYHQAHPIREFTVCYHAEAREGQQISLDWELAEGPVLLVDGHREKTDGPGARERVFSVKVEF